MSPSRSNFLFTLSELVGPPPIAGDWRDEWVSLNQETARVKGWKLPSAEDLSGDGKRGVAAKLRTYQHQVDFKVARGWTVENASTHVALSGVCSTVLGLSIQERSTRYAASAHALCDALAEAALAQEELSPVCYFLIHGKMGLAETVDKRFAALSQPDSHGFRGFTSDAEVHMLGETESFRIGLMFPADGAAPRQKRTAHGKIEWLDVEGGGVHGRRRIHPERS